MAGARAKYFCHHELTAKVLTGGILPSLPPVPTPGWMAYNERLDTAIARSEHIITQAEAHLAAPGSEFLPTELTLSELAEKADAERWIGGYRLADHTTDDMLDRNQRLSEDVVSLVDECEESDVPIPEDVKVPPLPPTPTLEELNVPEGVKDWIEETRAPGNQSPDEDPIATNQQPAVRARSEQVNKMAADLGNARIEEERMLKHCKTAVAARVRFFNSLPSAHQDEPKRSRLVSEKLRGTFFNRTFTHR